MTLWTWKFFFSLFILLKTVNHPHIVQQLNISIHLAFSVVYLMNELPKTQRFCGYFAQVNPRFCVNHYIHTSRVKERCTKTIIIAP